LGLELLLALALRLELLLTLLLGLLRLELLLALALGLELLLALLLGLLRLELLLALALGLELLLGLLCLELLLALALGLELLLALLLALLLGLLRLELALALLLGLLCLELALALLLGLQCLELLLALAFRLELLLAELFGLFLALRLDLCRALGMPLCMDCGNCNDRTSAPHPSSPPTANPGKIVDRDFAKADTIDAGCRSVQCDGPRSQRVQATWRQDSAVSRLERPVYRSSEQRQRKRGHAPAIGARRRISTDFLWSLE
jgi:hypothetical protein